MEECKRRRGIAIRVLQRLGIPFLFFVNKMDRAGARYDEVLSDMAKENGGQPALPYQPSAISADPPNRVEPIDMEMDHLRLCGAYLRRQNAAR